MSISTVAIEYRASRVRARAWDYVELAKPKISALLLVAVAVAAYVARWGQPSLWAVLHLLIGTSLVAASGSTLNQWIERERDSRMPRTQHRPLPSGRVSIPEAVALAAVGIILGLAYLHWNFGWTTSLLGFATWVLYVWIYTPLKVVSSANTVVGAVSGALPVLLGWSSTGAEFDFRAASLFTIMFLWQFPHFMAIAWIYRKQYSAAGFQMLTVVDPTGKRAGVNAVLTALALLPVSLIPAMVSPGSGVYMIGAFLLGTMQLAFAVVFCVRLDDVSARWLLRASLVYLPALLVLLMFVPLI